MPTLLKTDQITTFLRLARMAAEESGDLLVEKMGKVTIQEKNPKDFVTQADIESQSLIRRMIENEFPDHDFLGEESSGRIPHSSKATKEFCWIVDPLDGTTNYIHQLRSFSVSIALRYRSQIVVGCVRDPILDETYTAVLGGGAELNNVPINASGATSGNGALVAVSLPNHLARDSEELKQLVNLLVDSRATIRRLGSAALNLCYVACGRLDAYWAASAKIWDLAAGSLILSEAGAPMRHVSGRPFDWNDPQFIAAATNQLLEELRLCLSIEKFAN